MGKMRSWIFGSQRQTSEDSTQDASASATGSGNAAPPHRSSQEAITNIPQETPSRGFSSNRDTGGGMLSEGAVGFFSSVVGRSAGRSAAQDAEIERKVSLAARNVGDGVQRIVMMAKGRGDSTGDWKSQLLKLLGGSDKMGVSCDMDILLAHQTSDKFVQRCLENELPPNMIHCLRLLRVLELQHATQQHKKATDKKAPVQSISSKATSKVSQLLCRLCKDKAVGEQLQQHLFGLLALSGASYPASGVHVARAASQVIVAFSENCLNESLVWFLHDRKMIIHMTDDIRELCGMATSNSGSKDAGDGGNGSGSGTNATASPQTGSKTGAAALSLYGAPAEEHGLWAVSLATVVHLVVNSCNHECIELFRDFTSAKGNQVLQHAILNSKSKHGKKLMELIPLLASCRISVQMEDADESDTNSATINAIAASGDKMDSLSNRAMEKLAMNPAAFSIMEEIMFHSIPMLQAYEKEHQGKRPKITDDADSTSSLARYAIEVAKKQRFVAGKSQGAGENESFDLATDLLLACLQLYSEHAENYERLEEHNRLMTFYILSFPSFSDENLKVLVLKTAEFVISGVSGADFIQCISVMSDVFAAICKQLLHDSANNAVDTEEFNGFLVDARLMCETFESLLRFDNRVAPAVSQRGTLSNIVESLVGNVLHEWEAYKSQPAWQPRKFVVDGVEFVEPLATSPFDEVCCVICRVLAITYTQKSKQNHRLLYNAHDQTESTSGGTNENRQLTQFLVMCMEQLGGTASQSAAAVLESIMVNRKSLEALQEDMGYYLSVIGYFVDMFGRASGVLEVASKYADASALPSTTPATAASPAASTTPGITASRSFDLETIEFTSKGSVQRNTLSRVIDLLGMIKPVLKASSLAREAFRICGGFDCIIWIILSLGSSMESVDGDASTEGKEGMEDLIFSMLGAVLAIVETATAYQLERVQKANQYSSLALPANSLVDPVSTQFSPPSSGLQNRYFLRLKGFYLDLAVALSKTKLFNSPETARKVIAMAMAHIDPSLESTVATGSGNTPTAGATSSASAARRSKYRTIKNPDGARLVLGIAALLPKNDEAMIQLSKACCEEVVNLCQPAKSGSMLSQMATCGLTWSLTNPLEFAPLLDDVQHHLNSHFVNLLRHIASFSMSYGDFVATLRCIAGAMLWDNSSNRRVRLPVISSSIRQSTATDADNSRHGGEADEHDVDICRRLETLCTLAENEERVPHCVVGGDSINTISVLFHETKVEERLYKASEDGRLNFLEISSIDSSTLKPGGFLSAGSAATGSSTGGERVWTPLAGSGFSFSVWIRHPHVNDDKKDGNLHIFDLSNPAAAAQGTQGTAGFISVWYDLKEQRFNVFTSSSPRGEPTCFPVSPLLPGVWHHVLLTYTPFKRTMMGRKSAFHIYLDGRPLESDVKIESVNLPPNSKVLIGSPSVSIATSGVVRGMLPVWDLGPTLLMANVLMELDATALFMFGPDFEGVFWGDRPQRLSLSATGTAGFSMLAESGEPGSVASALRRREVSRLEHAGSVARELGLVADAGEDNDSLASLGLLCTLPPDCVIFAYRATAASVVKITSDTDAMSHSKRKPTDVMVNLARLNPTNEVVSTDADVYGKAGTVIPRCFADNVQWAGGPEILMPLINAAKSSKSLALALRLMRASTDRHPPNLEMMQSGAGYQTLALLLQGKRFVDSGVIDQCFAFAVHGFDASKEEEVKMINEFPYLKLPETSDRWVFSDIDAMKQLLLNHQVWVLRTAGPQIPLRLVSYMNCLVGQKSMHKAFNSRRLHLVGIVRWTLHLMIEAAELYTAGEFAQKNEKRKRFGSEDSFDVDFREKLGTNKGWYSEAPSVEAVSVGGDPDNPLLQSCKSLLRRVLTFMLTPGDLDAIADAAMYTLCIGQHTGRTSFADNRTSVSKKDPSMGSQRLMPGAVARVYLLRLLEELIVDGVNEIVAIPDKTNGNDGTTKPPANIRPHAGGIGNPGQTYLATALLGGATKEGAMHPKHTQAQNFLGAFARVLSPVWFAALLEGCHEEASASAVLRLMILMVQSSPNFAAEFEASGGFAPLVMSIPKYSTNSSITISLLSQLLRVSILHLPCFPTLNAAQLCVVFDEEDELSEIMTRAHARAALMKKIDPTAGIFALIAECIGRNLQLAPLDTEVGRKARETNDAILDLLTHRHVSSPAFQEYCRTPDFLEPLAQALCLLYDERFQRLHLQGLENHHMENNRENEKEDEAEAPSGKKATRRSRRGSLAQIPKDTTPTERLIGKQGEKLFHAGSDMVMMLRMIVSHAAMSGPIAAPLVAALFRSFPVHASTDQVEAYHLVLTEICKSVVDDAIELSEATSLASCVGICSVLLDRLLSGCFNSEAMLICMEASIALLRCVSSPESQASRSLATAEVSLIAVDIAHIARLSCLGVLYRSRSLFEGDEGDPELQALALECIDSNIEGLMIVPKNAGQNRKLSNNSIHPTPPTNSKLNPLWHSTSVARCSPSWAEFMYPDLSEIEDPLRMFIVGLMVEMPYALRDEDNDLRTYAINITVTLIQQRRGIMSGILIREIQVGDKLETVDAMNRGGFGALLVAHEAGGSSSKKMFGSFFDWLEKHGPKIDMVFEGNRSESMQLFPGLSNGAESPQQAIENEQELMSTRLRNEQTANDRTVVGGIERAEHAQNCIDRSAESHMHWKRHGFDDLASGATNWKFLLRRLKGSGSIWEGGPRVKSNSVLCRQRQLYATLVQSVAKTVSAPNEDEQMHQDLVKRWKLDLTEGTERQRRRLLPNYEFHGLYNIDEKIDLDVTHQDTESLASTTKSTDVDPSSKPDAAVDGEGQPASEISDGDEVSDDDNGDGVSRNVSDLKQQAIIVGSSGVEATAELLKELNIKKLETNGDDDDDFDDDDESHTVGTAVSGSSATDGNASVLEGSSSQAADEEPQPQPQAPENADDAENRAETENASSYDLITGLLQIGDWPEESYNVRRCTGLEVRKALLLWCKEAIYIIDGFESTDGEGLEGQIVRVEKEQSSYSINLRPKDFNASGDTSSDVGSNSNHEGTGGHGADSVKANKMTAQESTSDVLYQHRSQRIAFADLRSVFRRRYQLQQIALELYDIHNNGTLVAFASNKIREDVLAKVLESPLPNSLFSSNYGTSINYKKFMNNLKAKIVSQWVNGKMTNFEFLMHLNSFAGRSYNDLTQYPVFPWVIADYESEEIDLNDPNTYRDLSKPMGALGDERAQQFRDRYEALQANYFNEDEPPPFHYGTHYSCAAYVLYYLMRLEPFSRLALTLQGGRFDVADRLFHNIGSSWKSASEENLQDVRELIPEFFYLPDFLTNTNGFDFGTTQKGKPVHDVTLPKWAKGDPKRFIRINRMALESEYVSKNLHKWVDLVFGCKQRGEEAVKALNTFVHVTYEGSVDLDSMTDPVQRASTIAQIQNFGQTPSRLERRPFSQRFVYRPLKNDSIDFGALPYLAPLTPPFCIVGAVQRCQVKRNVTETCKMGLAGPDDRAVGDMCLVKGQIIGVGRMCALNIPSKTYVRYGGANDGVSVHTAVASTRNRELNKLISMHDILHRSEISALKVSLDGRWMITGCIDSTVRVWKNCERSFELCATLCGHEGWKITSLDVSTEFGTLVTGCAQGNVMLWDIRTLTFVRRLRHPFKDDSKKFMHQATSVSVNHLNGNIVTLVGSHLSVFDINGTLLASEYSPGAEPTCAVATDCPEWKEKGVVAITGHVNGEVRFWSLDSDVKTLTVRHLMVDLEHTCQITALRATGVDRQDTLLVGDESGKMSVFKTVQLENLSTKELTEVISELKAEQPKPNAKGDRKGAGELAAGILGLLPGQGRETEEAL